MKPGDKVYYLPGSNRRIDKPNPIETTIKTVGRKYFTVEASFRAKFEIGTGLEVTEYNNRSRVYFSLKEYTTEQERGELLWKARQAINTVRIGNLTNTQLETLISLLSPSA